ncbi:uncharacterized protein PHACADRAFT_210546 [Phanerochaete carnosa HHB-10118-sp]|uniref:Uncharacterized protein n=1 Tax=Phanerochaete carnosa (strain HHB-10118-sp) TaxID=650164 RepID=K5W730_PHACS|nr:uncharacterized protein PHACADRAFT_210546 [Phanerochaete carnosa HHB-10118-sp]EKM54764.1 hypothetical protein PHACADRAFT_210546 [Phanerochaete carnosa HHB-10118-sp]
MATSRRSRAHAVRSIGSHIMISSRARLVEEITFQRDVHIIPSSLQWRPGAATANPATVAPGSHRQVDSQYVESDHHPNRQEGIRRKDVHSEDQCQTDGQAEKKTTRRNRHILNIGVLQAGGRFAASEPWMSCPIMVVVSIENRSTLVLPIVHVTVIIIRHAWGKPVVVASPGQKSLRGLSGLGGGGERRYPADGARSPKRGGSTFRTSERHSSYRSEYNVRSGGRNSPRLKEQTSPDVHIIPSSLQWRPGAATANPATVAPGSHRQVDSQYVESDHHPNRQEGIRRKDVHSEDQCQTDGQAEKKTTRRNRHILNIGVLQAGGRFAASEPWMSCPIMVVVSIENRSTLVLPIVHVTVIIIRHAWGKPVVVASPGQKSLRGLSGLGGGGERRYPADGARSPKRGGSTFRTSERHSSYRSEYNVRSGGRNSPRLKEQTSP